MEIWRWSATILAFGAAVLIGCGHPVEASSSTPEELRKAGIIPDVIDTVPPQVLGVVFPNHGVKGRVKLGNEIDYKIIQSKPDIKIPEEPEKMYLVLMLDADYPSPDKPTGRSKLHWIIGNMEYDKGWNTFMDYVPPQPQQNGKHRFVILMYEQPEFMDLTKYTPEGGVFNARKFAKDYKLAGPVAGNFFRAEK